MNRFLLMLATVALLCSAGCSKNDDPDNGDYIKPNQTVADPTGTVTLSMRNGNNGETHLDNLYIGKDDNFTGYYCRIASLGPVNGLGNVSTIPVAGWATKVAVTPGNGYVAYDSSADTFYRIYVTEYLTAAGTGGVIGAEIKYQKPFKGLDENIRVKQDKVVLPAEGGSQQIVFENNSIIPFKVKSSEPWCVVKKASTRDQNFLYDAVVISCEESFAAKDATATVTIETLYGKEKTIEVTRAGKGEFINLSQEDILINYNSSPSTEALNVFTNIEPSDINISSSDEWLSGEFSGASYSPQRTVRWIENKPATRATLENPVSREFLVKTQGYNGAKARSGSLTLSYGNTKSTLRVTQSGAGFTMEETELTFEAGRALAKSVNWSGNVNRNSLTYIPEEENDTWVNIDFFDGYLNVSVLPNPSIEERTARIKIGRYISQEFIEFETITVTQQGASISLEKSEITFDASKNLTQTVKYSANFDRNMLGYEWKPADNDFSWVPTVNINYDNLTITVQSNPYETTREGTLQFIYKPNSSDKVSVGKINISQQGSAPQDRYVYFESPASNYTLPFAVKVGSKITSSADWCTATPNGQNIVLRVTNATEDRMATITIEGLTSKIYVSQSKYKVGDTYKLGDVNATVYKMTEGNGFIIYNLGNYIYAWSKENIDIQGASSLTDGRENMKAIKAIPDWENLYPAFAAVDKLNKDGITGWYLPAKNEYWASYGGYNYYGYWSSTQISANQAWDTYDHKLNKTDGRYVVAMNTFSYDFSKKESKRKK